MTDTTTTTQFNQRGSISSLFHFITFKDKRIRPDFEQINMTFPQCSNSVLFILVIVTLTLPLHNKSYPILLNSPRILKRIAYLSSLFIKI